MSTKRPEAGRWDRIRSEDHQGGHADRKGRQAPHTTSVRSKVIEMGVEWTRQGPGSLHTASRVTMHRPPRTRCGSHGEHAHHENTTAQVGIHDARHAAARCGFTLFDSLFASLLPVPRSEVCRCTVPTPLACLGTGHPPSRVFRTARS